MFKNTAYQTESTTRRPRGMGLVFPLLLALSLSCNFLTQSLPDSIGTGALSAEATSPVSVHIEWQAVPGASGYKLEGRYGSEFFPIADLPGDQTSYDHFVVPGSAEIAYRLNADENEIGAMTVRMPELDPNPLVVQTSLAGMGGVPEMGSGAMPTFDPSTIPEFDPNTLPSFDPNLIPGFDPSLLTPPASDSDPGSTPDPLAASGPPYTAQEIGPEGGTLTVKGLNGVTYTLVLPAGAVDQTTAVALWPAQDIGDLPFSSGLLGAVQVWPQIPFDTPLTLTIELPETGAASPKTGFSVMSGSNELFMVPIQTDGEIAYTYRVHWGDTFGLASATPQEIRDQAARIPTDSGAQMAQLIATLRSLSVDSGPQSEGILADQLLEGLLAQLDRIEVRAPIQGSASDDVYLISASRRDAGSGNGQRSQAAREVSNAVDTARSFFNEFAYGSSSGADSVSGVRDRLVAKIKAFVRKTELACLTEDAFYVTYLMNKLEWARVNAHPSQNFWAWLAEGYGPADTLKPCTFELEITSKVNLETRIAIGLVINSFEVSTPQPIKLKLGYRENSMFLYGVGPIQYDKFTATVPRCTPIEVSPYPEASLWIEDLSIEFDEDGNLSDFVLRRVRGNSLSSSTGSAGGTIFDLSGCNPKINFSDPPEPWTGAFMSSVELYRVYDMWEIGGSPPFFTATNSEFRRISGRIPFTDIIETTSLRLSLFGPDE